MNRRIDRVRLAADLTRVGGPAHAGQAERLAKEVEILLASGYDIKEITVATERKPQNDQAVPLSMLEEPDRIDTIQPKPKTP